VDQHQNEIIRSVQLSMKTGEYLQAYDQAEAGLKSFSDDKTLQYLAVLSLARQGATEQAQSLYDSFFLNQSIDSNHNALGARLIKDRALMSRLDQRSDMLLEAAQCYEQVYLSTQPRSYYPAVNAASMYFLAGAPEMAIKFANIVLSLCSEEEPNYWVHASMAEAYILVGDYEAAVAALLLANKFANGDWSSLAATQKQISLITTDQAVLTALELPRVIHYAGHIISPPNVSGGRFPADQEQRISNQVSMLLDTLDVGVGYGSLAAGADIIFAEEIIKRYGELHLAFPFSVDEFKQVSVAAAGEDWLVRFDQCLEQATSVNICSGGRYNNDNSLFNFCSLYSMGRACLRQQHLASPLSQIVVWDGEKTTSVAGTYTDQQTWADLGREGHAVFTSPSPRIEAVPSVNLNITNQPDADPALSNKKPYSILFGDIKGFSALPDAQLPMFVRRVLGCIAEVIEDIKQSDGSDAVLMANTWGDGLFVVIRDTSVAAKCALVMQQAILAIGISKDGFQNQVELRLGIHFGPIYEIEDPVTKRANYFGEHVNMAARIEPITPPSQVYVTESFAAQLTLSKGDSYKTEYVGIMPMAKDFGDLRMYLLRESAATF
jgi:class 3 adenylate cyclase/tetratricopeptide (TPR) repeat protein